MTSPFPPLANPSPMLAGFLFSPSLLFFWYSSSNVSAASPLPIVPVIRETAPAAPPMNRRTGKTLYIEGNLFELKNCKQLDKLRSFSRKQNFISQFYLNNASFENLANDNNYAISPDINYTVIIIPFLITFNKLELILGDHWRYMINLIYLLCIIQIHLAYWPLTYLCHMNNSYWPTAWPKRLLTPRARPSANSSGPWIAPCDKNR